MMLYSLVPSVLLGNPYVVSAMCNVFYFDNEPQHDTPDWCIITLHYYCGGGKMLDEKRLSIVVCQCAPEQVICWKYWVKIGRMAIVPQTDTPRWCNSTTLQHRGRHRVGTYEGAH